MSTGGTGKNFWSGKGSRMAEYINKSLAIETLECLRQEYEMHDDCDELVARKCKNAISALPAVVVKVVRCRECKHYKEFRTKKNKQIMRLFYSMGKHDMEYPVKPDDFCSYGEKKNE